MQDREFTIPNIQSLLIITAYPDITLFTGIGNEADKIVDDTNKIANEVKEHLELMVKTDTTGTRTTLLI